MIQDAINDALGQAWAGIWAKAVYYGTFAFLDPFWGWCACLLALYVVVLLLCYFFGTFWPVLRVIGGFLLLAATFGLFAYAKGESDARAHDKPVKKPAKH